MNHPHPSPGQIERHLKLWIYLLPIVGVIPALWTIYHPQNQIQSRVNREQQKVSRLAISLILVWLSSYSLLSLGAANAVDLMSFRFFYTNAILTTGYFVTCTFLMTRLSKKSLSLTAEIKEMNFSPIFRK
ncbi:hypothetical protein [Pleurocapsa sp. FMAR1]|uniref:hypothetical protein n=1 Tax=Pleurocapsa sp. FMAR1 TaxID=3040204 RepID=UPI0029C6D7C9|nr:hypothetical protein [Pleurocapsa sp. FMAR1]